MSYIKVPLISPFKFVRWGSTGIHFDDQWTRNQIHTYEMKVYYKQKWRRQVKTKLQVEASVAPQNLEYYDERGNMVKSTAWANVFATPNYSIYEVEVDFTTLPPGTYFLYVYAEDGINLYPYLSEPIDVKDNQPRTLLFEYNNYYNAHGVAWTTGIKMKFVCEAGLGKMTPKGERTSHVNQVFDVATLNGVATREIDLLVGTAVGVAPYVPDILNRIFKCSRVVIEGMQYQAAPDAEVEINYIKGSRLVGGRLAIVPAFNNDSLEYNDAAGSGILPPGVVTAYNIETAFFGPGSLVPILDIEQQG